MSVRVGRACLVVLFATAGACHFLMPSPFVAIVPRVFHNPAEIVVLSGAAELLGAAGLLIPRLRRIAGWSLILLLFAVFPANIQMLANARASHASSAWQIALWARLPVQAALVWLVWFVAARRNADGVAQG